MTPEEFYAQFNKKSTIDVHNEIQEDEKKFTLAEVIMYMSYFAEHQSNELFKNSIRFGTEEDMNEFIGWRKEKERWVNGQNLK